MNTAGCLKLSRIVLLNWKPRKFSLSPSAWQCYQRQFAKNLFVSKSTSCDPALLTSNFKENVKQHQSPLLATVWKLNLKNFFTGRNAIHKLLVSRPVVLQAVSCYSYPIRCFSTSAECLQQAGHFSSQSTQSKTSAILYICSLFVFMIGLSYAAVPLYRMFCQATGIGGDPTIGHKIDKVGTMKPIKERKIHVSFNADHHAAMQWNFKPSQNEITVVPGETALAFYTAKNPTDKPIVGIATYNVVPFQAGLYFNKIQCFCFEEQWLNPHEEVDMPVFFYIDPDYDDDPQLANVDDIILSYTFFKAEEGQTIPLPGFMKANSVVNLNKDAT